MDNLKKKFFDTVEKNRFLKVIWETGFGFYNDDCFTFTAAISFYFLLSFIPFLILLGASVGYIVDYIKDIHNLTSEQLISYIMDSLNMAIPFLSEKYVSSVVDIANYKAGLTTIGLVSLAVSATLLFSTLHYSFFRIFGGKSINFILSRLMGAVFLLTLAIVLFFVQYFLSLFLSFAGNIANKIPILQNLIDVISSGQTYSFAVSTVIIILFFWILINYFTYGIKLSKKAILCGALLFSVLWNAAKLLYNFYITEISNFSFIYGSAAWIITSILWVYYSALILLLCMEFIKTLSKIYPEKN
ncbi:YihY/virulence factor BrkB family protein [bacterium]|nr:YihY/virulence factor BrkB family protein [bacterium]